MSSNLQKVLFISHEASRTGATIFLLHLAGWLKANSSLELRVLFKTGGPMLEAFREIAPVRRLDQEGVEEDWLRDLSLVYSNTGTNGRLVEYFARRGAPVISHLHELEHELKLTGSDNLDRLFRCSAHFVACSEAVRDTVKDRFGIDDASISVIHEMIPVADVLRQADATAPGEVRAGLGFGEDEFVAGGAGTVSWRKGADLFLQAAAAVKKETAGNGRRFRFLWIGSLERSERRAEFEHDLARLGLEEDVIFTGEQSNPFPFYRALDLFCLPSREDPFPLVMLEAGTLGKPTLAFRDSGGATGYCERTGGLLAPYLDVREFARLICETARPGGEANLAALGASAEKVRDQFDTETLCPKLLRVMERVVEHGPLGSVVPSVVSDLGRLPTLASLARPSLQGRLFVSEGERFGRVPEREFAVIQKAENTVEVEFDAGDERGPVLRLRLEPADQPAIVEFKECSLYDAGDNVKIRDFLEEDGLGLSFSDDTVLLEERPGFVLLLVLGRKSRIYTPKLETGPLPDRLRLRLSYRADNGIAQTLRRHLATPVDGARQGSWVRRMVEGLRGK